MAARGRIPRREETAAATVIDAQADPVDRAQDTDPAVGTEQKTPSTADGRHISSATACPVRLALGAGLAFEERIEAATSDALTAA